MQLPHCPKCHSEYTYEDGGMFICRNAPTNGTMPSLRMITTRWWSKMPTVIYSPTATTSP